MADTFTPNLNLTKPEVGSSRDAWGTKWNDNADTIDAAVKAIQEAIANIPPGVPAGVIVDWASSLPAPAGWLKCNGAALSRAAYPALFNAIQGIYGLPDANTFLLPDIRGVFRRGLDEGRGADPGRVLNSIQYSQNMSHTHTLDGGGYVMQVYGSGPQLYVAGSDAPNIGIHAASLVASGGNEARPVNLAFPAIIKY